MPTGTNTDDRPPADTDHPASNTAVYIPVAEHRTRTQNRFLEKINVNADTGCWEWTASCLESGHGQFVTDKHQSAHRAAYRLFALDTVASDEVVRHQCPEQSDSCCNPQHLTTGSQSDNLEDAFHDGTMAAQFDGADIREIRRRYHVEDSLTYGDLADEHDVTITHVGDIIHRRVYAYVEDDLPADLAPGKGRPGELSDADIREIRYRYQRDATSHAGLAEDYPIGRSMIGRITRRERYDHI